MRDMNAVEMHSIYDKGECPDCLSTSFLDGPCGGVMMNVTCAGCGSKFNVSLAAPLRFGQVMGEVANPEPSKRAETQTSSSLLEMRRAEMRAESMFQLVLWVSAALLCSVFIGNYIWQRYWVNSILEPDVDWTANWTIASVCGILGFTVISSLTRRNHIRRAPAPLPSDKVVEPLDS